MARGNPAETISEKPLTNVLIVVLILVVIAAVVFVVLRGRQGKPNARVDPLADYPEVYDPHKIGPRRLRCFLQAAGTHHR